MRTALGSSGPKASPPSLALKNNEGWVERKIVHQDNFDVYAVACAADKTLEEHFHPMHDQYIWVMSGLIEFGFETEEDETNSTQVLRPGAAVTIPRGQTHWMQPEKRSSLMTMFRPPATGEVPDAEILSSMIPNATI